jgi:hypothetical protein
MLVPGGGVAAFAAVSGYGADIGIIAACGRAVKFRRPVPQGRSSRALPGRSDSVLA